MTGRKVGDAFLLLPVLLAVDMSINGFMTYIMYTFVLNSTIEGREAVTTDLGIRYWTLLNCVMQHYTTLVRTQIGKCYRII